MRYSLANQKSFMGFRESYEVSPKRSKIRPRPFFKALAERAPRQSFSAVRAATNPPGRCEKEMRSKVERDVGESSQRRDLGWMIGRSPWVRMFKNKVNAGLGDCERTTSCKIWVLDLNVSLWHHMHSTFRSTFLLWAESF